MEEGHVGNAVITNKNIKKDCSLNLAWITLILQNCVLTMSQN